MTLLISKKDRTFDFIHPDEESPHHITHLSSERLSQDYIFSDTKKHAWRSYELNKKCEELAQKLEKTMKGTMKGSMKGMKPELWEELTKKMPVEEIGRVPCILTDYEKRVNHRHAIAEKKLLVPRRPVWFSARCFDVSDWVSRYGPFVEDIYTYVSNYIADLNNSGYDIKVNERELQRRLVNYMYNTSENVLRNYVFLK